MLKYRWVKAFIWFMVIFFFYLASVILISELKPGPTESDAMRFMAGFMSAMDQSLMGIAMGIENDPQIISIIVNSAKLFIPISIISLALGLALRVLRRRDRNAP